MTDHLEHEGLKSSDEAWLVVDKDQWTDEQLTQLHQWSLQQENYGFALSNPKFEYWLLLHFEDGTGVTSSRDCTERLKRWIPEYDKGSIRGKSARHKSIMPFAVQGNGIIRRARTGREALGRRPCIA